MHVELYFHSPCFDGAVSAALAAEYFEQTLGLSEISLIGVNYHLKNQWLSFSSDGRMAIVDFLYHPSAFFWADHHPTTFLNDSLREQYARRDHSALLYDNTAPSCAAVLWKGFGKCIKPPAHFEELVNWANRIDAARYASVDEAIGFNSPAAQISLALSRSRTDELAKRVIVMLRKLPLPEIASTPEIHEPFLKASSLYEQGLERLKQSLRLTDDGVAIFDVNEADVLINRYAPFYFYPDARYSAGIVRGKETAKLTAMRNPWREFPSAPLGEFCAAYGGGGHQRVGSIVLRPGEIQTASNVLTQLLAKVAEWEKQKT